MKAAKKRRLASDDLQFALHVYDRHNRTLWRHWGYYGNPRRDQWLICCVMPLLIPALGLPDEIEPLVSEYIHDLFASRFRKRRSGKPYKEDWASWVPNSRPSSQLSLV
jgi:hypothetical protein